MKKCLSIALILMSFFGFSQTENQVKEITKDYDLELIEQKRKEYLDKQNAQLEKARKLASLNKWPLTKKDQDGSYKVLIGVDEDGSPIYLYSDNDNAALATRTNYLNSGGSLGLNLNGQGIVFRVWDEGLVRATHNQLSGRVTVVDDLTGTVFRDHSNHVTGTLIASGAGDAKLRGMAYQATARTYNFVQDKAEVLTEISSGMLLSNHSYGFAFGETAATAWKNGAYDKEAREWDDLAVLAPYYLSVHSAGNNGEKVNPAPLATGLDKLIGGKNSKNNLVVANAEVINIDGNGNFLNASIRSTSSQGPSDDRRIKPDITGLGSNILSLSGASDTATFTASGTSMASPNVAGTLGLVQQHYNNVNNKFMLAATLKALACGTADDAGTVGPDPVFGWGVMNGKKAVETINAIGTSSWISEEKLPQGQTYVLGVKSTGTEPLIATVSWTDLPGDEITRTSAFKKSLVNDIDVRIVKVSDKVTTFPWKLDPANPAVAIRNADNDVDTVEQVKIDSPGATEYQVIVTHKGTLVGGLQNFSLVLTGASPSFSIAPTVNSFEKCTTDNAVYTFDYKQIGTGATTFSAAGLPTGATAVFSNPSMSTSGTVTLTINNLANAVPGQVYGIEITGTKGLEKQTKSVTLKVYSSNHLPTTLVSPVNDAKDVGLTTTLKWNKDLNATSYELQVATDVNFSNLIVNQTQTVNEYKIINLLSDTKYYWRVTPTNFCGTADRNAQTKYSFSNGVINCAIPEFVATDFSNAPIDISSSSTVANVPITVSGGHIIGDINVALKVDHNILKDIKVSLIGPASIGSPVVVLFNNICELNDNIDCTVDDSGVLPVCVATPTQATTPPSISISGTVSPFERLSSLNGLNADGVWTIRVEDYTFAGGGKGVTAASLKICSRTTPVLSVNEQVLSQIGVYPNPTTGILNISLNNLENVNARLFDIQGRQVLSKNELDNNTNLDLNNLQNGVYILTLEKDNVKQTRKIILNK
jgi:subtilisin-like proprotein convertase family protein